MKVALSTDISATSLTCGEMIVDNYELDIADCIHGLTAQQQKFEARLGAQLYADAPTCVQDLLLEDDKRTFQGAESSLQMIKPAEVMPERSGMSMEQVYIRMVQRAIRKSK